jgi:hypothetical protein
MGRDCGMAGIRGQARFLNVGRLLSQEGLRRTWSGSLQTIRNVLRSVRPHDFAGAAREARGIQTGFDHVTEMRQNMTALEGAIGSLQGSLRNPNLSGTERRALQQAVRIAQRTLDNMRRAISGQ